MVTVWRIYVARGRRFEKKKIAEKISHFTVFIAEKAVDGEYFKYGTVLPRYKLECALRVNRLTWIRIH